ncbi:MAG: hypothetical protein KUG81_09090 [Gammaproteobacteria bacterium]|nr:hypothetical protein [Gammaproteobacteria bacterium]
MKAKKPKYEYGHNKMRIESPAEALADADIMMAKAEETAAKDPWAIGTAMLGGFLMENSGAIAGGIGNMQGGGSTSFDTPDDASLYNNDPSAMYAENGKTGATGEVEVEGGEVYETEDGEMGEFKGPSHAQGGIDVEMDSRTNIFSKKVMKDGDSMADRKKSRESKLAKIEKRMLDNPTDKLLKTTYERSRTNFAKEEMADLATQQLVGAIMGSKADQVGLKAEFGIMDWIGGLFNKEDENFQDPNESTNESTALGTSFGDMMSVGGNLFSGIAPLLNTLKQRATDTKNVNAFEDFGEDALDANEEAQGYISAQKDDALQDIIKSGGAQRTKTRNSARGVSSMMAGDLATFSAETDAKGNVYNDFAKQMMGLLSDKSGLENVQDKAVMTGEAQRDADDRADKDAFYTAKGQDLATLGTSIQQTGKDLNEAKQQKAMKKILDQLSQYGITFDSNYNLQNPE